MRFLSISPVRILAPQSFCFAYKKTKLTLGFAPDQSSRLCGVTSFFAALHISPFGSFRTCQRLVALALSFGSVPLYLALGDRSITSNVDIKRDPMVPRVALSYSISTNFGDGAKDGAIEHSSPT